MMVVQITERIYAIKASFSLSPFCVWVYIVVHPELQRVLLIDSGRAGSDKTIARAMRMMGHPLTDLGGIVITHWHGDHTGSVGRLIEATDHKISIYGSDADLDAYLAQEPLPLKIRPFLFASRGVQISHAPGKLCQRDAVSYVRLTSENARSALSEWGIAAIPTPGHTVGHMASLSIPDRAMFCGDALMHLGRHLYTLGFYPDLEQMDAPAQWLLRQEFDWLLPAHVSPVRKRVPLPARENVGQRGGWDARLLERFSAFKYQATIG